MIPIFATVDARFAHHRRLRVWIPLFLAWLLLLPLVLVLFPVIFLVGLSVRVSALRLYVTAWQILGSMRDTVVEVENEEMAFQFRIV